MSSRGPKQGKKGQGPRVTPKRRPRTPLKKLGRNAQGRPAPPIRERKRVPFWIVVRTKGGQENWARKNIEKQGLKTFLPLFIPPERQFRAEPLWPGYIFVQVVDRWHMIRNTYGVSHILMDGDKLSKVPRKIMRALLKSADKDRIVKLPSQRPLIEGELVEIQIGSFQMQKGVYIGPTEKDRIAVLLEFMGQKIPYEIERRKVKPVKDDNAGE